MKSLIRNIVIISTEALAATLFFLASGVGLATIASAQGYRVDGVTQSRSGFPAAAVTIAVCVEPATVTTRPCSTLATLYTDSTLATPCSGVLQPPLATSGGAASSCSNPLIADGLGNYHYYVASGRYALQFYGSGITAYAQRDQIYPCTIGNCTSTGDVFFKSGRPWYDVRAFGAMGNDSTNDITSLQAAADTACVTGGTVYVPFGTYKTLTTWLFPSLTSLAPCSNVTILFAPGATLHFTPTCPCSTGVNGSAILTGTGPSSDRAITGNITAGTTSFVATSAGSTADLVANNWLLVYLQDPVLLDAVNIDFVQVASVAGTTVNIKQPFQTNFAPSGGQTLVFQNMDANTASGIMENFAIRGGGIIKTDLAGQSVGSAVVNGLLLYWTKGAWVTDTTFITIPGNGTAGFVSQFRSQGAHIVHNRFVGQGSNAQIIAAEQAESVDWEFSDNVLESENTSTTGPYLHIDFGSSRFSVIGNKLNNGGANGGACYICAETGIHDGVISNNEIGLMAGQEKGISLLGAKNVTITGNTLLGPITSGFAGSLGINLGTDTGSTPNITSANNIVSHNRVGTVNAFQTPYQVAATDLIIQDDGSGNAKINNTLSVGGGTALASTNQSGTGSICMTANCAMTGVPTVNGVAIAGGFTAVNVTPVTANANTAADQNGTAITVTAGALNSVLRTLLVQLAGVYSTPAASTSVITDKLKLCTVSGCGSGTVITLATWTTTALGGIQATNDPYNCTLNATTQTAGASAAFEAHGNLTIDLAALATAAEAVFADNNTATVGTINSTAQLFLQHTRAFSNASASNSFTDRQMIADTVD